MARIYEQTGAGEVVVQVALESTDGVYLVSETSGRRRWELHRMSDFAKYGDSEESFVRNASPLEVELLQALVEKGRSA